ncbi:hypothetical protein ACFX2H_041259 [Malus domestica]
MKSGKVDSAAKVAPKPAPFAAEIDSPQIQDLKLAISELRFATYAKKRVDELQRVRVSLLKKNEQLKGEKDGLEASIGEVVGEVSAQTGAARGEASDDAAAKSVTAVEDGIHLFGAFSVGSDEGFSASSTCKCQKSPSGGVGVVRVCSATSEESLGRSVASPRLGVKTQ